MSLKMCHNALHSSVHTQNNDVLIIIVYDSKVSYYSIYAHNGNIINPSMHNIKALTDHKPLADQSLSQILHWRQTLDDWRGRIQLYEGLRSAQREGCCGSQGQGSSDHGISAAVLPILCCIQDIASPYLYYIKERGVYV